MFQNNSSKMRSQFTQIPNIYFDVVSIHLKTVAEYRVMNHMLRHTFGMMYVRGDDVYEAGTNYIANACDISRRSVQRTIKRLEELELLICIRSKSKRNAKMHNPNKYQINFDFFYTTMEKCTMADSQDRDASNVTADTTIVMPSVTPPLVPHSSLEVESLVTPNKNNLNNQQHADAVAESTKFTDAEQHALNSLLELRVLKKQAKQIVGDHNWTSEEIINLVSYAKSQKNIRNPAGLVMKMYRDDDKAPFLNRGHSGAFAQLTESKITLNAKREEIIVERKAQLKRKHEEIQLLHRKYGTDDQVDLLADELEAVRTTAGKALSNLLASAVLVSKEQDKAILVMPNHKATEKLIRKTGNIETIRQFLRVELVEVVTNSLGG